ncbi:hypothetical protein HDU93_004185, partial [Gonapodya sp. JEL0774]
MSVADSIADSLWISISTEQIAATDLGTTKTGVVPDEEQERDTAESSVTTIYSPSKPPTMTTDIPQPLLTAPTFATAVPSYRTPSFATMGVSNSPLLAPHISLPEHLDGTKEDSKENDSGYLVTSDHAVLIKTKIVCTIGPKTQTVENIGKLVCLVNAFLTILISPTPTIPHIDSEQVEAGMNVVRMNFSHGDHAFHLKTIKAIRAYLAQRKTPKHVAILLDTKGPEIRTGKLANPSVELQLSAGQIFTFHNDKTRFVDEKSGWTTYNLAGSVVPGNRILVGDGLIGFEVLKVDKATGEVTTRVENDGLLGDTKGVNLPAVEVLLPAITEKDEKDILFGVEQG